MLDNSEKGCKILANTSFNMFHYQCQSIQNLVLSFLKQAEDKGLQPSIPEYKDFSCSLSGYPYNYLIIIQEEISMFITG